MDNDYIFSHIVYYIHFQSMKSNNAQFVLSRRHFYI